VAVSLLAARAHAGDIVVARKAFSEGVRLYQKGDFEGARRLFKQADAEHHAPPIVYNLGLAEERLEHPQAAVDAYEAYVAEAGDTGEYSATAAVAIAQIKARSTRLRVESKPAGARVFVDGAPLAEPSPTTLLVTSGHHVVVVQGDGWRDEKEIETRGAGDLATIGLFAPEPAEPPAPTPAPHAQPAAAQPERPPPPPSPAAEAAPDGFVWGASFAIVPTYLFGVVTPGADNARPGASIVAGPFIDLGLALTDRFELVFRGLAGIGPDAKPSYAYMGGPAVSFRVARPLWIGAAFLGGQFETRAHGQRYGTDLVFGALAEASLVVLEKPEGQWIASFMPSFLLTEMHVDNTTIFFPLMFGYRAF
jgi:hypothetical protein